LCKKPGPTVELVAPDGGTARLESIWHPRGCMGARQDHLDIILPRRPLCGLREAFRRGGSVFRPVISGDGRLRIDLSRHLGYYCVLELEWPGRETPRRVYIMLTRGGRLYVGRVK